MARHEAVDDDLRQLIVNEVNAFLKNAACSDAELGRRAGVPQTFVWHVKRGRFAKITPRLRRLRQYIHIETEAPDAEVERLMQAVRAFLAAGGDIAVLRSSIDMLTRAYAGGR